LVFEKSSVVVGTTFFVFIPTKESALDFKGKSV